MNYTNIFSSLETDSQKIIIDGDWKEYFKAKPYADHYKQSWLIKRVIDLEATPHGATILNKEAEIAELKAQINQLQTDKAEETRRKNEYKKQVQSLNKKLITTISDSQNLADKRIAEISNFYAGITSADKRELAKQITALNKDVATLKRVNQEWRIEAENNYNDYVETWDDMMKAEIKFANLKSKTTKEQENSEKAHKDEIDKLIRDQDLDHINFVKELNKLEENHRQTEKKANDDKEIMEKEHAQKLKDLDDELKKSNQKLYNLINKPTATIETQTDITGETLTKYAKNQWKSLVVIKDRIKRLSETNILQISNRASQFNIEYSNWLDGYEKKWGDLITLLDEGERANTDPTRPLANN